MLISAKNRTSKNSKKQMFLNLFFPKNLMATYTHVLGVINMAFVGNESVKRKARFATKALRH